MNLDNTRLKEMNANYPKLAYPLIIEPLENDKDKLTFEEVFIKYWSTFRVLLSGARYVIKNPVIKWAIKLTIHAGNTLERKLKS